MIPRRFLAAALAGLMLAAFTFPTRADDATVTTYNIRHFLGFGNADYGGYWGNAPWVLDGTYENRWYPDPNRSLLIDGQWMTFWQFFENVLNEVNSDIIILQEVPTGAQGGTEIIAELATRLGMYHYTMPSVGGTQFHWLAILSRYPIVDVKNYSAERDIDYHGLIRARVRLAQGALLDVFSTHLDSASEFWRQDNLAKIIPAMQESPYPHVLGCDLNAAVNSTCYNMLVNAGYRESRGQGIDFIWLSPGGKITELQNATAVWQRWTGTGEPRGSDHAAIKTTVRVSPVTPPLHVEGKHFKDPEGNIVVLRGVAMIHTPDMDLWRPGHQWMIDQVTTQTNGWHAKVIRIGVRVESYLADPNNIVDNHLIPAVNYCASKGLYCIVDWHYIDDARTKDAQTRQFWNHVAPIFKDYDNVLFEVFNEHKIDSPWAEWKSTAQPWVDLIRSHAPDNIILVSGPFYSQHIEGAATNPFNGTNLAYVAHIYPGGWYPLTWDGNIGVVADVHPVVVTEWGYDPTGTGPDHEVTFGTRDNFGIPFQTWAENKGVSWIAWVSDYAWGPPMWNSNWTPNDFGNFAKDWLYARRNDNQPGGGGGSSPPPDPTFTSSASASPNPVAANATTAISAPITCASGTLAGGVVDLEIYNASGTRVAQQYWTGQNFNTGQSITYSWNWSTATAGAYTVRIGVFTSGWADTLHWNGNAGTITVSDPLPGAPTGLAAATAHKTVSLTWNSVSGATGYNVKRSGASGGPYTTIGANVTGATYTDTSVVNGSTYYYVISAINNAGEGSNSAQISATPTAPSFTTSAMASPSTVVANGSTTITATITCNSSALNNGIVDIEIYNAAGTRVAQQFWTGQSFVAGQTDQYSWPWTAPATLGNYTIRVGVFSAGWADSLNWNANAGTITVNDPLPAAPTGLAATTAHETVALSWNSVAGATGYNVKRGTANGGPYTTIGANITAASYADASVANATTYYYVVSAINNAGEGSNSAQISATPAAPAFTTSATATPSTVAANGSTTIAATITCNTSALNDGIVDIEVYNAAGTRVAQQFWTGQSFTAGETAVYTWPWTAPATAGNYTVRIGVFSAGWADTLNWNSTASTVRVASTVIRLNSGGAAAGWFAADGNVTGGTAGSTTATISTAGVTDPAPAAVYQTERYGAFTYTIPNLTAGATYTVRLHFAEIYWTAANQRKFNVKINGTQVLTNFDIYAAAGARNKAVVRQFTATANSSRQIIIQYLAGTANNPQSSGIEIIR